MKPNWVLLTLIAAAGTTALALALLAAEAHGRRRARRWPREAGCS